MSVVVGGTIWGVMMKPPPRHKASGGDVYAAVPGEEFVLGDNEDEDSEEEEERESEDGKPAV